MEFDPKGPSIPYLWLFVPKMDLYPKWTQSPVIGSTWTLGVRGAGLASEIAATWGSCEQPAFGRALRILPIVSIVVPFFGLTNSILRIPKGNPQKELQWRL